MDHTYLFLDPGITTGYSIFSPKEKREKLILNYMDGGEVRSSSLQAHLLHLRSQFQSLTVVVEGLQLQYLPSSLRTDLNHVTKTINEVFPRYEELKAGDWKKNLPNTIERSLPSSWSRHKKDAYLMGAWYIIQKGVEKS